ncbi:expressed unknown protein [Seminavis robusta]|uniref:Uncharacterized protein n=1 Tax=Seminavis robusta TaxID=568900 RepID=A0A9N8DE08_9STRA|nr:expressed unknown protein [Seminavis robusta]|eukprot:Sro50_g029220.1 n/a (466) ;mRNA; r:120905-122611
MLMNYHELTMDESADSPNKRRQFRLICAVMAIAVTYMTLSSGALKPVVVEEGTFGGGDFRYKLIGRDYAASNSLLESIAGDLNVKERQYESVMHTIYVDDPMTVHGRRQRFAGGVLLTEQTPQLLVARDGTVTSNEERIATMAALNKEMKVTTEQEQDDMPAADLWPRLKYQRQQLPAVRAAKVKFTFTNGFVSSLVHSYKVFPAIREYAKTHGDPGIVPVVMTTCSIMDSYCIHYVPMENGESFRLGLEERFPSAGEGLVNWKGVYGMLVKIVTLGQGGKDDVETDTKPVTTTTTTIKSESKEQPAKPTTDDKPKETSTSDTTTEESAPSEEDTAATTSTATEKEPSSEEVAEETAATDREVPLEEATVVPDEPAVEETANTTNEEPTTIDEPANEEVAEETANVEEPATEATSTTEEATATTEEAATASEPVVEDPQTVPSTEEVPPSEETGSTEQHSTREEL